MRGAAARAARAAGAPRGRRIRHAALHPLRARVGQARVARRLSAECLVGGGAGTNHRLRWTMPRTFRLIDVAALSPVVLLVAACAESSAPTAPQTQFRTELIRCEASVSAGTLDCAASQPQATQQAARGMSFDLVLGGQGALVRLASSGTAYNSGTQTFSSNVTVENLISQPMNTADGTTPDAGGVKVFFNSGPTVTRGTGVVSVANPDGTGAVTGSNQEYFQYSDGAVLLSGATPAAQLWPVTVPTTVATSEIPHLWA